jgi:U3 small nucleolar RNA-associated protein 7
LLKAEEPLPPRLLLRDKKTNTLITSQYHRNKLKQERTKISALLHNFQPGYMQAEDGEETLKVTQSQMKDLVNIQTASNIFDLDLPLGRYQCEYSPNGSTLALTSSMGHVCVVDWRTKIPIL